jgi:hypothetical protein
MDASTKSRVTITTKTIMVDGNAFNILTPEGRMAARAYAYTIAAEGDEETKRRIIRIVGRNDG